MQSNKLPALLSSHLSVIPHLKRTATIGVLISLSACTTAFNHLPTENQVTVPEKWQEATNDTNHLPASVENGWLTSFNDKELNRYVGIALKKNPNLLDSAAQLKQAIDQVRIANASLWPSLQASGRKSRTTVEGQGLSQANELNTSIGVTSETRTVRSTLDVSWELDLWGKLTQRKKSAAYSAKAQAELYKYAELSLVANVSRAWYTLVANKLQLDLAQQRLDSFKNTASLINENYQRGISSALDVYLSRSDVQQQISSRSTARYDYLESVRAFKVMLGEYPNSAIEFDAKLPELSAAVPTGLPAQLLTRRPDIKASQLTYQAEIASAKAAQRDLYPSINFTGAIGDSREDFSDLFVGDNLIQTFITDLTAPIFASGALRAARNQAIYSAESAYADLISTSLNAFEEVENSLARETSLEERKTSVTEAVALAENGLELALDRYKLGIENYNTVLESQRRLFDSKEAEINISNALLQNRISIHLALGGDFSGEENRDPLDSLPSLEKSTQAVTDEQGNEGK